ncbi:MAG: SOSS complex subunit B family protein [Nanoarchaeota archaeon]|nr:SOSS complex subunit B family protein [Nanoarchaeota archaeon]
MKINELQVKQGKVDITVEITAKEDVREFEKFGKAGRVCNVKIKDDTGEITLTLWNEQIDQVNVGDKVHVANGYVSEWQGEMQLSTGKFGSMEVLDKEGGESTKTTAPASDASPTPETTAPQAAPEPADDFSSSIDEEEVL